MKKIIITQGNEFKVFDNDIQKNEDIFEDIYNKANEQKIQLENYTAEILRKDNQFIEPVDYLNNVIAFCGERGQGKSTAMQHFVGELGKEIGIEVLKVIDPMALEMAHNIVDIIISRLFDDFRSERKNMDKKYDLEFVQSFQKIHRNISVLKNAKRFIEREYAYDSSIQNLSDITDSMDMKKNIMELVRLFLKYKKKQMLIIPIDDLDLNLKDVYSVAEQLRKYFMIPQIVIVMAVNINQLTLCVERELLTKLNPLRDSGRWDIKREARNMSNRYMEKLIPLTRRMQLPNVRAIAEDGENAVEIIYKDQQETRNLFDSGKSGIEKGILKLIYEKTGLIYIAKPNEIHPVIPITLRELVNLISLLGDMSDNQRENLELFEQYFCNVWLENNLSDESVAMVRKIASTQTNALQRDTFISLYEMWRNRLIKEEKTPSTELEDSVERAYTEFRKGGRKPKNGDIINCLRLLELGRESEISRLTIAVTTLFSIRMLKLKASESWKFLYDFIGPNFFGEYRLIREEAIKTTNKNSRIKVQTNSRLKFEYSVQSFIESNNSISIDKNMSVSAIKRLLREEQLVDTLVLMGIISDFKDSDGESREMVSQNNQVATKAEFNLSQIFLSAVSPERVAEKISSKKWGINERDFCNAAQQRVFLTEGWKELACNMEEIMNLAQYVQEHRNISDKAQEIDYYNHFFESVDQFLSGLKDYLPLLGELNGGDLAGMGEVIVRLKADKAEGQASGQEPGVPRSSRANTKFYTLLDNLRKLSDYAVWKQSLNDDDTYQNLLQEINELEVLAEKGGKNQEIGSEISEQYNMLKKSVVG